MRDLFRALARLQIILAAIKVSLVVGTLLNIINQYEAIFAEQPWRWGLALMNYLVPYAVSSYSGALQLIKRTDRC
ncbi:hypothetical protein GCM10010919_04400 [Alishewanella longhuensis]|uniref:Uncharacterized protein n=1 Tax=Alishewanella longhuensis TaxID=1091037 RepID=A0ABQ3KVS4_9ALTE|nr:nitrate/nitrite transporter NrtS [Alishewanella longhuensis]GHG60732.1 hypothetical protein GCM10010919_04400 [Alishewanella longhuensis]